MKKKTTYSAAPKEISRAITVSEVIEDFLPAPELLIKKQDTVKVTILLSKNSVDFFKDRARKIGVPYQAMIKTVLDRYALHYQNNNTE